MTDKTLLNRIPGETVDTFTTWALPPIDDNGRTLSSAEKEAKERRDLLLKRKSETIETIDIPESPTNSGMTAQEMQAIFDEAQENGFEQGHTEGFKEGLAKGSAEGYEAGKQQALMELRPKMVAEQQRFQKLVQQLLNPLAEQEDDIEQMLLDAICSLTQSVVQRELMTDSSHILSLVKDAVEALPIGAKNLRISLNPDDLAAVETYAEEQQLDWKFVSSETLQPGGCIIETPESRVDFSVSKRLEQVLAQFLTKQLGRDLDEQTEVESADHEPESPIKSATTNAADELSAVEHSIASPIESPTESSTEQTGEQVSSNEPSPNT